MSEPAVACTLTPGQLKCQAAELLPGLARRATSVEWTETGVRFVFTPTSELLAAVARTIDLERACCAFLTSRFEVPAAGGAFVLELSGPPGTKEFLEDLGIPRPDHAA